MRIICKVSETPKLFKDFAGENVKIC